MATPKFPSVDHSFHAELKKRINDYFQATGNSLAGNTRLYTKAAVLITCFLFFVCAPRIFYARNFSCNR